MNKKDVAIGALFFAASYTLCRFGEGAARALGRKIFGPKNAQDDTTEEEIETEIEPTSIDGETEQTG
jgi:hypothetical protein